MIIFAAKERDYGKNLQYGWAKQTGNGIHH